MAPVSAPSAAGAPCRARSSQPPAARVAVPPASWAACLSTLGALEIRRPLLDPRDLGLDDVLAAPRLVEHLLVQVRPVLQVGAVVVEHPFGMLQAQRREPGDLGGPRLGIGQGADAV